MVQVLCEYLVKCKFLLSSEPELTIVITGLWGNPGRSFTVITSMWDGDGRQSCEWQPPPQEDLSVKQSGRKLILKTCHTLKHRAMTSL